MKILRFLAMMLTALALVPVGAHLFALPNKIHLAATDYFVTQNIYRGWVLLGVVLIAAILANITLTVLMRGQGARFFYTLINLVCLLRHSLSFAFTFPANQATDNRTKVPPGDSHARQWEISD